MNPLRFPSARYSEIFSDHFDSFFSILQEFDDADGDKRKYIAFDFFLILEYCSWFYSKLFIFSYPYFTDKTLDLFLKELFYRRTRIDRPASITRFSQEQFNTVLNARLTSYLQYMVYPELLYFPENEADRTAMVSLDPSSILYMNYSLYSVRNKNFATYDIIRDYRDYNPSDIYFVAGTLIGFEMLNLDFFQMASDNLDGYFNMLDEMRSCSRK